MESITPASSRPAQSLLYSRNATRLPLIVAAILLSAGAASIAWAQPLPPPDQIEPPAETTGWKFTELVSKNSTDNDYNPDIVTGSDGRLFAAWAETVANTVNRKLLFSERLAGYGRPWSTPALITDITLEGGWHETPCPALASGGGDWAHLVWNVDRTDNAAGIFYKKYNAQTKTWEPATQVISGRPKGCPGLVADANDNLHLVWTQADGVYYRPFDKNLNAWLEAVRLSQAANTYSAPALAMGENGSVHVAWVAGNSGSGSALHYRNRSPGIPWSEVQTLVATKPAVLCPPSNTNNDRPAFIVPALAAEKDGTVHLAWSQMICRRISVNNVPEAHVLYKRYSAATGWTSDEDISGPRPPGNANRDSTAPDLALTTGRGFWPTSPGQKPVLHVLWKEKTWVWQSGYNNRIWYRNYTVASGAWSEPDEVQKFDEPMQSGQFVEFSRPTLSVDNSRARGVSVHTAWTYKTGLLDSGPDSDVFYRRYLHTAPLLIERTVIAISILVLLAIGAIYGYRRYRS